MFLENTRNTIKKHGWIEVICGSMFSGKTEELIRRLKRANFAKQNIEIFKPKLDNRYSSERVVSHDDNSIHSTPVNHSDEILKFFTENPNLDVVGIDEAQFFDQALVDVCNYLADNGVRVLVAGLDMDFKGRPFGPIPHLLACAEYVTKVHAICPKCGNLAQYSHRITASDKLVLLGEKNDYEPLCRCCFTKANAKNGSENQKQVLQTT